MATAKSPSGKKISRAELIQCVLDSGFALDGALTKGQLKEILDAYEDEITAALRAGDNVKTGLGIFKRRDKPAKKARKGMNPFTKQEQMFKAQPARKAVKFFPGKAIKDALA